MRPLPRLQRQKMQVQQRVFLPTARAASACIPRVISMLCSPTSTQSNSSCHRLHKTCPTPFFSPQFTQLPLSSHLGTTLPTHANDSGPCFARGRPVTGEWCVRDRFGHQARLRWMKGRRERLLLSQPTYLGLSGSGPADPVVAAVAAVAALSADAALFASC